MSRKFARGALGLWASEDYVQRQGTAARRRRSSRRNHEIDRLLAHPREFSADLGTEGARITPPQQLAPYGLTTCRRSGLRAERLRHWAAAGCHHARHVATRACCPEFSTEQAHVYFVYPAQRFLSPNVRVFMEMAHAQ